jgi:iron complex outermembrane receptor protein
MNTRINFACAGGAAILLAQLAHAQGPENDEHHQVDEIIVTATPLERTVEQLAQPTSVVSGDTLLRHDAASIGEVLADQPGASASYFGPVASRPVIRGQYGERVLMLANGLDALDASALSGDHAVSIDSILAERVEIVRGPATLLYGSGAAGGIVNVVDSRIRETPLDAPVAGALSLGNDSATGMNSVAAKLDAGSENLAGHVDWFRKTTDDVEIPGYAESQRLRDMEPEAADGAEEEAFGVVENTDSSIEGGSAAATWFGAAGHIGLSLSRYDSNYGIPGTHHAHEEGGPEAPVGGGEQEEDVRIDLEQTRYDLSGELDTAGFLESISFRIAQNDYSHTELEGEEAGTMFATDGIDSRIEFRQRAGDRWDGAFGLQFKDVDFSAIGEEAFVPPSVTRQLSLFTFQEYILSDTLVLQGSARIERQELDSDGQASYEDEAFGASIGAIWSLSEALTLSGNLALTERHPNSTELYADGPHVATSQYEVGSVAQGNGLLRNETSTNLDMTLRGVYDGLEFSLTAFVNAVDDYILLRPTAAEIDELQVFEYGQADVDMYGFEAEAVIELMRTGSAHMHARLFSDFVFAEESRSGAYLPRIPPLRYGASLHYVRDSFEASVELDLFDGQERTAAFELPTDAYTLLGAQASYRVGESVLVFLRGKNLADEDARRHTSPLKDELPLPGRSLQAGFRWDF